MGKTLLLAIIASSLGRGLYTHAPRVYVIASRTCTCKCACAWVRAATSQAQQGPRLWSGAQSHSAQHGPIAQIEAIRAINKATWRARACMMYAHANAYVCACTFACMHSSMCMCACIEALRARQHCACAYTYWQLKLAGHRLKQQADSKYSCSAAFSTASICGKSGRAAEDHLALNEEDQEARAVFCIRRG